MNDADAVDQAFGHVQDVRCQYHGAARPRAVVQQVLDLDGKYDILWRDNTTGTVAIWLLNGLSVSSSAALGAVPAEWTIAETGDFNSDGKSDLLWRNTTSAAVATWFMNGLQVSSSALIATVGLDWTI